MTSEWKNHQVHMQSSQGVSTDCSIEYRLWRPLKMVAYSTVFGCIEVVSDDLFEALCFVRLEAEKHGFLLLCNGARIDAYPSRMSRQMGFGAQIYVFKSGVQARKDDMVDLLDPALYDQVTTVEKQRGNFEAWLNSLGSTPGAATEGAG